MQYVPAHAVTLLPFHKMSQDIIPKYRNTAQTFLRMETGRYSELLVPRFKKGKVVPVKGPWRAIGL
jgi:hypothetical protein